MSFTSKKNSFFGKILLVAWGMGCLLSTPCSAAIDNITDDLKPLDGYVVTTKNDEFIIDLDAKQGVAVGDLFSVLGQGEELIHPITQKVIGRLDDVKGVLKVVRINDGFSFARSLTGPSAIKRGDPIRRFAALQAIFWDYTEKNKPVFDRLQRELPALQWQDYQSAQAKRPKNPVPLRGQNDALLFIVTSTALEVRDGQLGLIRQYPIDETAPTGHSMLAAPAAGGFIGGVESQKSTSAVPVYEKKEVAMVDYGSADAIAQLGDNTLMADLLQHGDQRMLAATDSKKIRVYTFEDRLKLVAETEARGFGKILTVKWWRPATDGPLYLVALAWADEKIDSTVFVLEKDNLVSVAAGMDTILGSFDLDSDGQPETLLSQEYNADSFFGRRIKEMYWHNGQLQQKKHDLQLPPKFTVIGGQLADLTGDGKLEAAYVRNGILWIYSGKTRLYNSAKQMGGSLSVLTYKINPTVIDYRTTSTFFEIAPIATDVDADGRRELIVVSSNQSAVRVPGIMTTIDKSRIMVFKHDNGTFIKGTMGEPVEAAIQGLDVVDGQILYVATEPGSLLDPGGSSRLQALKITP
ncbi:MAG: hypothetical protein WBB19_00405 [Desulforhopalus sp.]